MATTEVFQDWDSPHGNITNKMTRKSTTRTTTTTKTTTRSEEVSSMKRCCSFVAIVIAKENIGGK